MLEEAEKYLAHRIETLRESRVYGTRPKRQFHRAAKRYWMEYHQIKRSIRTDECLLRNLDDYIGDMHIDAIHMGSLQHFIAARRADGVKTRTINHAIALVRRILNLAASEWVDDSGLTWLASPPKLRLLPEPDLRKPYPLNWEEQRKLFRELPTHLKRMALFAVNTGCRDREVCGLRWAWEQWIPELKTSVFVIPSNCVKNGEPRLVVLNRIAQDVINKARGDHEDFVFAFRGKPIQRMLNSGWKNARKRAGLPNIRVHDLKHTYGRRLRAADVSYEDRQDLLGHKSSRITTHYSAAEIDKLLDASNRVCDLEGTTPTLTLIRSAANQILGPAKVRQRLLKD